jgi:hypothetical protein
VTFEVAKSRFDVCITHGLDVAPAWAIVPSAISIATPRPDVTLAAATPYNRAAATEEFRCPPHRSPA